MIVNVAPLLKESVGARVGYRVAEDPIDPHGENAGLLDAQVTSIDAEIRAMTKDWLRSRPADGVGRVVSWPRR